MRTDDDPGERPRGPKQEEGSPGGPIICGHPPPQRVAQSAQGRKLRGQQRSGIERVKRRPGRRVRRKGVRALVRVEAIVALRVPALHLAKGARPRGGARR